MESNPLISIIVPCYNIENKVSKCIESLIEQNYKKIEVICINDASTDNTLEILNSFQECDGRIRVINLAQNGGLANGRRVGVKEAFGEFIAFVDGDDWVKRDYIQTLYRAQRQSNCDVVICENYRQSFKHVSVVRSGTKKQLKGKLITGEGLKKISLNFFGYSLYPLSAWGKLYRKKLFNLDQMPTIDVFFQEDILMNLYIFKNISSIQFINYPGYYYRIGGGTANTTRRYIDDMKSVYKIKRSFLVDKKFEHENAMNYILIELKNCLYIYFSRRQKSAANIEDVKQEAKYELNDDLYNDFNDFDGDYLSLNNELEYTVIRDKDVDTFLSIANQQDGLIAKLKSLIKKFL